MAALRILVSVFAAGAFGKRIATKHDTDRLQLQKEAVANGPAILPGSVQSALPARPAVMPRGNVPVGMSMQDGANPGKFPAELRPDWKGPANVQLQVKPDVGPEEIAAMEATDEKAEKYKLNIRRAYDSLSRDIPEILQFESEGKAPMDWDIYTDDLETTFPRICTTDDGCSLDDSAMLALFIGVAATHIPSWTASIKGKDLHKAGLQELRTFIDKKVEKAVVTGQDWCMGKDADWCVLMEPVSGLDPELSDYEGDEVITSNWKTELTMNTELTTHPEAIVTIQGLSRFHLNVEGKIYRHSIDELQIRLNQEIKPEEAELFLVRLANAPRAV